MATSPPGFTSAYQPKHTNAYRAVELTYLPPSVATRQESDARIEFLKARTSLARVESDILDWHKDLREKDLSVETVAAKAPMFLEDYKAALARRDKAQAAYEATVAAAEPTRTLGTVAPRTPGDSKLFPGLKGVGRRTRNGHTRLRRRTRRRVSRRKVKA
jgi:hypothetical protein